MVGLPLGGLEVCDEGLGGLGQVIGGGSHFVERCGRVAGHGDLLAGRAELGED